MVYAMENNWLELFRKEYKPLLKDKYDEFEYGLSCPKARHIRLSKCRNIDYMQELESISSLESLSQYENMYKVVEEKENIVESITFQTGGAYIMNPSSLAPVKILMSYMGQNPVILDVSSAPGGKTCALSDMSNRKGVIVANEISSSRLKSLHFNLEKYGAYNVKTVSLDGRLLPKYLDIQEKDIVYDIGAGTGSCAFEFAGHAKNGLVYAFEKEEEAYNLICENKKNLKRYNVECVKGNAPDILRDIESPDKVFIGGSSGKIEDIYSIIYEKNSNAVITVTAITIETLYKSIEAFKKYGIEPEIVCINSAKSKKVGPYHMMMGNNPVYIITGRK